jgi:hypothetical protein
MDSDSTSETVSSFGAHKAKRSNNAADWMPRDVLLDCLAKMDAGEINPAGLIISFYEEHDGGLTDVRFSASCPNVIMATGCLHRAINLLGEPGIK